MKKKKKRIPSFIYNTENYIYPDGFLVTDEAELDDKLKNGWDTGPVDNPVKKETAVKKVAPQSKAKPLHHMKISEMLPIAKEMGIEIDQRWKRHDLMKAIKAAKE